MAPHPGCARLVRAGLARGIRRPRLELDPEVHLRRGVGARRYGPHPAVRDQHGGPGDPGVRHARAEAAVPAADAGGGDLVVPGLFGAGSRIGPGRAVDPRGARRRPLCRQRPEDLDHAGPVRRLGLLPGAHRSRRQEAGRHQLPADRHEVARRHGAPDHHPGRRPRGQRGVAGGRPGPGGEPRVRGEQGLDLRQVPAPSAPWSGCARPPRPKPATMASPSTRTPSSAAR